MTEDQRNQFEQWWEGLDNQAKARVIVLQQMQAEGKVTHNQKNSCLLFESVEDMEELDRQAQRLAAYVESEEIN